MAMAFAMPAHALDWRLERSVGASATYTDNAKQSETNPENALILSVTPGFTLRSEGSRRVQATLQYGLTGVARVGEDESTDLNHRFNAIGKAELIEDFLFIDGNARISQELISLFGSPADAEINDSNRATVGTYSISPYIQKRLGTFANAQARYTNSGAIFENDVAASSTVNAASAGLTSGTRFTDLSWGLNYSIRKAENRNAATAAANDDTTFERASASVGYALTRKFRVFGTVGQDWNEYLSATDTDGSSWSAGFGWAPTRRTSVEASVGERYFGNTYSFSGSHRTRKSRWTVRYYEDVSDITQTLLDQSSQLYFVCATAPHFPPASDLAELPPPNCIGPYPAGLLAFIYRDNYGVSTTDLIEAGFPTSIANGVYIIKGLTAGVSWDVGRLGFGLSAYDTRRFYQLLGDAEDQVVGVTGSVSYRLSPRTTARSSLSLSRTSTDILLTAGGAPREDDLVSLSLGLNHSFADKLNGALIFRHTQRDSNAADADYEENRLTASVNMRF
ncbi:MAG: TIGR03016 family PEP-CTERM system-associated outer membrane protein [Gammaproteobacteria bacterium]|nr:TIGR03016 family PEP-CTERM system-associated outer membrane protein [Gammaproteobacteria bacterium]